MQIQIIYFFLWGGGGGQWGRGIFYSQSQTLNVNVINFSLSRVIVQVSVALKRTVVGND